MQRAVNGQSAATELQSPTSESMAAIRCRSGAGFCSAGVASVTCRCTRGCEWEVPTAIEAGTMATGKLEMPQATTGGAQSRQNTHKKRIGNWTDSALEQAMNSITDDGISLR